MASDNSLQVITGIRYTKEALRAVTGMTYLFDPNWVASDYEEATFPVSFFHIKAIREQYDAEVSQKQMLFYNAGTTATPSSTGGGLLNVVSDNIVIKPKQYVMDVIIPFSKVFLLDEGFMFNSNQLASVYSTLRANKATNPFLSISTAYIEVIKNLLKTVINADYTSVSDVMNSVLSTPDYNKNSIEAMWRSRRILKFKNWNTMKYKYVAITNMTINKEATEDGVYEASLTIQELPILTLRNDSENSSLRKPYSNKLVETAGDAVIQTLNAMEL